MLEDMVYRYDPATGESTPVGIVTRDEDPTDQGRQLPPQASL